MKTAYKAVLINLLFAIIITAFNLLADGVNTGADVAFSFGVACLGISVLDLIIGVSMLIAGNKNWGRGFLLSSAALLLLSGISCSGGLSGMKF